MVYRTGRHNRQELIYWQPGPEKSDNDELRMVLVKGPLTGADVVFALNQCLQLTTIEENGYIDD